MISTLHMRLLGGFLLVSGGMTVIRIDIPRLQSLLAYLVLHHNAPQSRSHLAFLLWPDSTETQAHTNLRNLIHKLRQVLPNADSYLRSDRQELQWGLDAPWTLDVLDFERALAQADEAKRAGNKTEMRRALARAAELYQGDLLPNCYDEWVMPERDRLRQAFLKTLDQLIELLEQERDYEGAINAAQRLLRHDPLHEATYRNLMRLYAVMGDRIAALRTYHTCTTVLERELGVEPSRVTRDAYERLMQTEEPPAEQKITHTTLFAAVPLVGRQHEWAQLQNTWRNAVTGQPHLLVLSGEAGIGKTRLAEELLTWVGRQGIATATAHCYAVGGGLAYAPIAAWLRSDVLRAGLSTLSEIWLSEVARLLPDLLEEHPHLPHPGPLTESWQRQHLFEALARAILSGNRSLLLLLDDMQWCDRETMEWLHYLLRFDEQAPMLLIGTVRTEETEIEHPLEILLKSLRRDGLVTEIALGSLDAAQTAYLAAHLAGHDLDPATVSGLYQETEGNPLFVVETVRARAMEQGVAVQQPAESRTAPYGSMLPPTVQAVITARLAQLSPVAREVGSVASVIGRAFTFDVLAKASGSDEDALVRGLDELWQRRIVREQGQNAYDFSHDKLREGAYNALSGARRRMLHRRVAEALEVLHASNLNAVSSQVAAHYEQAGLTQQAITYYQQAGKVALQVYANADAMTSFQRALALLETTSPARSQREISAQLNEQIGDVFYLTGQSDEAKKAYQQALARVPEEERIWQARLPRKAAKILETQRRYEEALDTYSMAESALGEPPTEDAQKWWQEWIEIQVGRIEAYYWQAKVQQMTELVKKIWIAEEEYGTADQRAAFFLSLAGTNLRQDCYVVSEDTLRYARIALAAYRETGNLVKIALAQYTLGFYYLWLGDLDQAEEQMQAALSIAERTGDVMVQSHCWTYLTMVRRKRGQAEETRRFCSQALTMATLVKRSEYIGTVKANLAWVAWREHNLSDARGQGQAALKVWQQTPVVYPFHWTALFPLIGVALAENRIAEAVDSARGLLKPGQQRLPDTLTASIERAIQAWDANQVEAALTHLHQATTLAQEMGYL